MSRKIFQHILGYVIGGLIFLILLPYGLFHASLYLDHLIPIQLIPSLALRFIIAIMLLVIGLFFGFWSNIIQNIKGKGGPLEFANVAISPKT